MEDGTSSALGSEKVTEEQCVPVCRLLRDVLDRIGDKWSLLVINLLSGRTMRFMDIRRAVLERTAYPTVPVTVEYCLTPLGTTLIHSVIALVGCGRDTCKVGHSGASATSVYFGQGPAALTARPAQPDWRDAQHTAQHLDLLAR